MIFPKIVRYWWMVLEVAQNCQIFDIIVKYHQIFSIFFQYHQILFDGFRYYPILSNVISWTIIYHKYLMDVLEYCNVWMSDIVLYCQILIFKGFSSFFHGIFKSSSSLFWKTLPGFHISVSMGIKYILKTYVLYTYSKELHCYFHGSSNI